MTQADAIKILSQLPIEVQEKLLEKAKKLLDKQNREAAYRAQPSLPIFEEDN